MLSPKRTKYRKAQKGNNRGTAYRGSDVSFGDFAMQATEPGRVTSRQIEAARMAFRDRGAFLADPRQRETQLARLLAPDYLAALARHIDDKRAADRTRAIRATRDVIERGGPGILFQPFVDLASGRTFGVEALARFGIVASPKFRHEPRGTITKFLIGNREIDHQISSHLAQRHHRAVTEYV